MRCDRTLFAVKGNSARLRFLRRNACDEILLRRSHPSLKVLDLPVNSPEDLVVHTVIAQPVVTAAD
ncbi:MAG: hypothetical protein KME25_21280 [Symplocastrum torsivum CPER-KK1]|uniref:Uncharacterized protein n=1 Tax=Symplocastrum torsivum CPER-KK1 TaxID=450513 RepID=A0A951PNK7_9CYAN|nr:hypothetical protein [Symplocastrum torsivum CPER-KK1]